MKTPLKILFGATMAFMSYMAIKTSLESNLFKEWDFLAGIPWMRATLWDFYFNVLAISCWVIYKETNWLARIAWIIALVLLGSIATSAYVLVQLFRMKKGDTFADLLTRRN